MKGCFSSLMINGFELSVFGGAIVVVKLSCGGPVGADGEGVNSSLRVIIGGGGTAVLDVFIISAVTTLATVGIWSIWPVDWRFAAIFWIALSMSACSWKELLVGMNWGGIAWGKFIAIGGIPCIGFGGKSNGCGGGGGILSAEDIGV
jgi:hypothetical protein